jgi:hypothetical protein
LKKLKHAAELKNTKIREQPLQQLCAPILLLQQATLGKMLVHPPVCLHIVRRHQLQQLLRLLDL